MIHRLSKPLFICLLLTVSSFFAMQAHAQYARLVFYGAEGEAFQVSANGKQLTPQPATRLQVRVNHGKKYEFKVQTTQGMAEKTVRVSPNLISADYVLKQNKKGEWDLKVRGAQMDQSAMASTSQPAEEKKGGGGIKFEYETTESYSGPDGAYSKSEKGSGTLGADGLKTSSTKTEASMDDKGFNMSSETKERSTGALDALGGMAQMGKAAKNKKQQAANKEPVDGQDLVVEEIQLAGGMSGQTMGNAGAATSAPAPAASAGVATTSIASSGMPETSWDGAPEGMGQALSEQGLEFYVMAEPVKAYEVVFEVEAKLGMADMVDKKRGYQNMIEALADEVNKTSRKKKYIDQKIDAVLLHDGSEAKVIRFVETGAPLIAKVHLHEGAEMYLTSKPLREYEVVHTYENTGVMYGKIDIEARTHRSIKRVKKENPDLEFDAVVSPNGMTYEFVKFK